MGTIEQSADLTLPEHKGDRPNNRGVIGKMTRTHRTTKGGTWGIVKYINMKIKSLGVGRRGIS